jgi:hypothetical protein
MVLGQHPYRVRILSVSEAKTRKELRRKVIVAFLEEEVGIGRKRPSRYDYIVETLSDGRRIYLRRPTSQHSFNFEVWVEKWDTEGDACPSRDELLNDLKAKFTEDPRKFQSLLEAITRVYNCEEPDAIREYCSDLNFQEGQTAETLLKTLKWLFISEDVHNWNHSGRELLKPYLSYTFYAV